MKPKWQKRADYVTSVLEGNDGALWKALQAREPDLLKGLGITTPAEAVSLFASADPNEHRKPYLGWLVSTYIRGGYLLEDLSKARETLALFDQLKHRLPEESRDINRFSYLGDVWSKLEDLLPREDEDGWSPSKRAAERELRRQVMNDTRLLVAREDGFTMAIPMSEEASKWWGRGTRWCTAADNHNMFNHYHSKSPLVVMRWPDGRKIQAWLRPDSAQIMDEADRRVSKDFVRGHWAEMSPLFPKAAAYGFLSKDLVAIFPTDMWTPEIALEIVRANGMALDFIPEGMRTKSVLMAAVSHDGSALRYVDQKKRTPELCRTAVQSNAWAIQFVPERLVGKELILLAARQNALILNNIPQEFIDHEVALAAVTQNGFSIAYIDDHALKTPEVVKAAVMNKPTSIQCVPAHLITTEAAMEAIKKDGHMLRYVPEKMKTPEMCLAAVQQNGCALNFVPKGCMTPEIIHEAVKNTGFAIANVPKDMITKELVLSAVERGGSVLGVVPQPWKTKEVCEAAVRIDGFALHAVPVKFKTRELCREALRTYGLALEYVPKVTAGLALAAVQQNGWALEFVPRDLMTEEIIWTALKNDWDAVRFVPDEMRNESMKSYAARQKIAEMKHEAADIWRERLDIWVDIAKDVSALSIPSPNMGEKTSPMVPGPCP